MGASARYRPNLETNRLVYNGQVANLSYGVPHHSAEVLLKSRPACSELHRPRDRKERDQ